MNNKRYLNLHYENVIFSNTINVDDGVSVFYSFSTLILEAVTQQMSFCNQADFVNKLKEYQDESESAILKFWIPTFSLLKLFSPMLIFTYDFASTIFVRSQIL